MRVGDETTMASPVFFFFFFPIFYCFFFIWAFVFHLEYTEDRGNVIAHNKYYPRFYLREHSSLMS